MSAVLEQFDTATLDALTDKELKFLEWSLRWREAARPKQLAPLTPWNNWGILTGRGFGKTLTGAHWSLEGACMEPASFGGLIAPTLDDVRYTLIEGPTGLLGPDVGFPTDLVDDYNVSHHKLTLWNGSIIRGFSSEKPSKLRGPQHHRVWGDEVAAWENAVETYDMMKLGLRLGKDSKFMWTTTPKPNKIVKLLLAARNSVVITGTSYENRDNLSKTFWEEIAQYEGTKLGRQELQGMVLDAEEDGIIESGWIRRWPHGKPLPRFKLIIASLDTAFTAKDVDKKSHDPDMSVMQVWGVFVIGREYHVMMLDRWGDYLKFPDLVSRVKAELKRTYGDADEPMFRPIIPGATAGHQGKPVDLVIIEDKGSGISLRQQLAFENILAHPYNPGRADKLLRLHLVSPMFKSGRVWMIESKLRPGKVISWAEPAREAICTFRGEGSISKDDDVDSATQVLKYVKDNFMSALTEPDGSHVPDQKRDRGSSGVATQNPYDG